MLSPIVPKIFEYYLLQSVMIYYRPTGIKKLSVSHALSVYQHRQLIIVRIMVQ